MPNELEGGNNTTGGDANQISEIGGKTSGDSQGDNLDAFRMSDPPEKAANQDNEALVEQPKADGDAGTSQAIEAAATAGNDSTFKLAEVSENQGSASLEKQKEYTDNSVNKPRTPEYLAKHQNTSDPEIASLVADLRDGMAWHEEKTGVKGLASYQEKNSVGSMLG